MVECINVGSLGQETSLYLDLVLLEFRDTALILAELIGLQNQVIDSAQLRFDS